MKEFKLYVGMTEDHMIEVLHSGLKNDSIPETFSIRYTNDAGVVFPTRYVKIVPLSAYGQSFHTSIWYVSLTGVTDSTIVDQVLANYDEHRESAALRHILKHLRQRRLLTPYKTILDRCKLQVEHPSITELYECLVLQGNWRKTEKLLEKLSGAGLFRAYLQSCQPHAAWRRLYGLDADGDAPSQRGGHAMCIDHENGLIYLLGGWDGEKSLDDFWEYNIRQDKWRVLSPSTSADKNGPGPRSCHKMAFDGKTGCIYVLGRLNEMDALKIQGDTTPHGQFGAGDSPTSAFCSEFYRYHTRGLDTGKWDLLSFDTATAGGPPLIFDHQMVIDSETQIIYVFGGRVVDGNVDTVKYSGFYSYNIRLSKWRVLQHPEPSNNNQVHIPPRFGHSMVLEPCSRILFIFAGQREDKYLSDMYAYDISSSTVVELYSNFTTAGGPEACFTQRAVIDPKLKEIYVFCGLTRHHSAGSSTMLPSDSPNWVYRYNSRPGKWIQILPEPDDNGQHTDGDSDRSSREPIPRYAHQVVYDPNTGTIYMHGGNAGIVGAMERIGSPYSDEVDEDGDTTSRHTVSSERKEEKKEKRLDDFWCMTLKRPEPAEVIRRATYMIRRQQFREMCDQQPSVQALHFLQTEVSMVVNHKDPTETEIFRSLLTHLLSPQLQSKKTVPPIAHDDDDSPPRKRSRPNTPEGAWTNKLEDDYVTVVSPLDTEATTQGHLIHPTVLQSIPDPEEERFRSNADEMLSAARFKQRTEVFESLMEFVADEAKQPSSSLLDMVDRSEVGL